MLDHLDEKYGPHGYLKLWIPGSSNEQRLHQFWWQMKDRDTLRRRIQDLLQDLSI